MIDHILYQFTNIKNGKRYRGIHTVDEGKTWKDFENPDYHYWAPGGKLFQSALKKYGKENFTRKVLLHCKSRKLISDMEKIFVDKNEIRENNPMSYNLKIGGDTDKPCGGVGFTTQKLRDEHSIRMTGSGNPMYGKHHKKKTKRKISDSHKGKKMGPMSDDHKLKISKANKGKKRSIEYRNNKSASLKKAYKEGTIIPTSICTLRYFNLDDKIYVSTSKASSDYGVTRRTINHWINNPMKINCYLLEV